MRVCPARGRFMLSNPFVPLAIVHHANQYLITNGYHNRSGLAEILGPKDATSGLRAILHLHEQYEIPFHLHVSGTLIEACAWYDPLFLKEISELRQSGLIEIIGSTYAQNIMTLFDREHNHHQIQEELSLIRKWFDSDLSDITGFWIPERVWDTKLLATILTDSELDNKGFNYILVDDRLFLPKGERDRFDQSHSFIPKLFEPKYIKDGQGLIGLPLSSEMRHNLLFDTEQNEQNLNALLTKLYNEVKNGRDVIAIYGDDMEKAAGIPPWNENAISQYHAFLQWLKTRQDAKPVLLNTWLNSLKVQSTIPVGPGTYRELAKDFGAGENYMGWASSPAWLPYQAIISKSWSKLKSLSAYCDKNSPMFQLARKHLLACTYETAWHDAPNSIHTDVNNDIKANGDAIIGLPAPWACTLASHARAANVLMEAVKWEQDTMNEEKLYAFLGDIDGDGHEEVILRNDTVAVVISPHFGGRIVYMFYFNENNGALIVGNPSDDWNWLEELNDYMDVPMNHPGAFADGHFEHDSYEVYSIKMKENNEAEVVMKNNQKNSEAYGMKKRFSLKKDGNEVRIYYENIPTKILPLTINIGLSPDYLRLLRDGRSVVVPYNYGGKRGFRNGRIFVWSYFNSSDAKWTISPDPIFGHGFCLSLSITSSDVSLFLGVNHIHTDYSLKNTKNE